MKKTFMWILALGMSFTLVACSRNKEQKEVAATEGIKFNQAYTTQPVCGPARSALFTGQFPCVNGAFSNCNAPGLNVKSIGQRLQDKGILTGYIGKWHLDGGDYFGLGRAPEGWDADTWYDMRNYLEELTEEERFKSRKSETMKQEDIPPEFTFAFRCADRAVKFIRSHQDEDFFLVVSFDEPHEPSLAPQPYASMYQDFELPKRPNVYDTLEGKPDHQKVWAGEKRLEDKERLRIKAPELFGCNSFVDSQIGWVAESAKRFLNMPALLYTTDHGTMLDSHCLNGKGPAAYEEICHIPMILCGFGVGEVNTPVSHIDVTATVWDYFGFEKPVMFQGESLMAFVYEKEAKRRDVFIEFGRYETDHDGFGGYQPMRCIFDGRYKLVINLLSQDEFYDLEKDPYEMENRIDDPEFWEVRDNMLGRLLDHMNQIRDPFRGYCWERRPWNTKASPATWEYTGYTRQRQEPDYEPLQLDYSTGLTAKDLVRKKELG
ncbi:MAG: sulfatase-like hydrolase/transferase [Hungatella sp.]|nr:sulfatase-like hydrolase/transferase [Hungatella sp.]